MRVKWKSVWAWMMCVVALFVHRAAAEIKVAPVLSSHMVLQRQKPVPIWGSGVAGERVTVSFRDQQQSTFADDAGRWLVELAPMAEGGPDVLTISGTSILKLEDVLVGEVWLGSGQSNMALNTSHFVKNDPDLSRIIASGPYPRFRIWARDGWGQSTPANCANASALMLGFGARLQQELGVPVGIMVGAVSGTPSGFWISQKAFDNDAACRAAVARYGRTYDFNGEMRRYANFMAFWQARVEQDRLAGRVLSPPPPRPLHPGEGRGDIGHLFETNIRPLIPFALRGVLWDQGESGTAIQGVDQFTVMGALIRAWRSEWGQDDFPFLYVQKPSGGNSAFDPTDPVTRLADVFAPLPKEVPNDGAERETYLRISQYPNTAMVGSSDLGGGIHPLNKSGYGARAMRVALSFVYNRPGEYSGPIYRSHTIQGRFARVSFSHIGRGLTMRPAPPLQGFAVAGADRKWQWAQAAIEGGTVLVWSDRVQHPIAVRYAWSSSHAWANLFNKDGLPALAFRTDDW